MATATRVSLIPSAIALSPLTFANSLRVSSRVYAMATVSKTKIYGLKLSTCTKRVLVALEEKNVTDYDLVTVDVFKGEHKSAEFKKKQPFGVIPVLEDEDVELFESRAIARYIADKYAEQGTNLLGSTLKERALVNLWLEVESQNYNPPVLGLLAEKIYKARRGLAPDEAKAAEYKTKLSEVLDVYEAHLAANDYLAGSSFSLADLVHLPYTAVLWVCGDSDVVTSRPNVNKWWERISSRPSWQKVFAMK
ncbi:unnamed protein product [Closterium sp. NIES-54]